MESRHVTIGPEFFDKVKNDYADWRFALVREFNQNSMDCGSSTICWHIYAEDGKTIVMVHNDGEPMSRDVLVDKLFSLGSSGKNFEGSAGGFGKAKEILLFCHDSYKVESGEHVVTGSGASFDLSNGEYLAGTRSTIVLDGDHVDDILSALRRFIDYSQWGGCFLIDGTPREGGLRKGSPRRELGFGTVYTNNSFSHTLIVRIAGQPMFSRPIGLDKCVILELSGTSGDVLTSNRDGLVNPYDSQLSDFITELSVDKRSALKKSRHIGPRLVRYEGHKLSYVKAASVAEVIAVGDAPLEFVAAHGDDPLVDGDAEVHDPVFHESVGGFVPSAQSIRDGGGVTHVRGSVVMSEFFVKNDTDLMVPNYYKPEEFSSYSQKLIRIWGRIMLEMHRLFDVEAQFAVGFLFSEDDEAQHDDGEYGKIYFIAPAKVVEQSVSYSKSFKKRFKLTERNRLIMIGLHEFVHALGLSWHDEAYANRLTDLSWRVMDQRSRFNWCFK